MASLPETAERDRLELDLQMMVGGVAQGAIGHSAPRALQGYTRAYELARRLDDRFTAALAGSRLWIGFYGDGDLAGMLRSVETTYEELAPAANAVERALLRACSASALVFMGRFLETEAVVDETSTVLDAAGNDLVPVEYYYLSQFAHTRITQMLINLISGRARSWVSNARTIGDELHDLGSMGGVIALTMLIYTHYIARDWAGVEAAAARMGRAISEIEGAAHYLDLITLVRARIAALDGGGGAAAVIDQTMERPSYAFAMQHLPRYLMIAGDAHADSGDPVRARACFEEALKGGPFGSQQWLRSELLRRLGDLALAGDHGEAEARYQEALEVAREQGAVLFELRAALALARLPHAKRQARAAAELLASVCARMPEPGPDLEEATSFLTALGAAEA